MRIVKGKTIISYPVLSTTCHNISLGNSSAGTTPPRAKGKKMSESADSPKTVLNMARAEKWRQWSSSFILLIT